MNFGMIIYVIGWVLCFEAAFMMPACAVAVLAYLVVDMVRGIRAYIRKKNRAL